MRRRGNGAKACTNTQRALSWTNWVRALPAQLFILSSSSTGQDFKRVGLNTLTDILNVVAPPIAEHEVIQVWLSHDMRGYEGVENLVYRALARVSLCNRLRLHTLINASA